MYFVTLKFWLFFFGVALVHWTLPRRWRPWFLLGTSYFYYATWAVELLGLMLLSTGVSFVSAYFVGPEFSPALRRLSLGLGIFYHLSILVAFRYLTSFFDFLKAFGPPPVSILSQMQQDTLLPVGISFFTLQCLSFSIDRYWGQFAQMPRMREVALYVSFFPQLLAGPVERASHLIPQFLQTRSFTWNDVRAGIERIALGLFQKVVVADTLAPLVGTVFDNPLSTGPQIALGTAVFALQLYGDFAGYSNIAVGIARLLGFELTINFIRPFFAQNPREFWYRWHITVSTWLRDYFYFPVRPVLGRSLALFLAFFLMGVWHGSGVNFVLMGCLLGLVRVAYQWVGPMVPEATHPVGIGAYRFLNFLAFLPAMLACRSDNLTHFKQLCVGLTRGWANWGGISEMVAYGAPVIVPLLLFEWGQERFPQRGKTTQRVWVARSALTITGMAMALLWKRGASMPFIYFVF